MEGILICFIVVLSLLAGSLLLFLPGKSLGLWRGLLLSVTVIEIVLSFFTYSKFLIGNKEFLEFRVQWLRLSFGSFGRLFVDFHLKVDGLNLALLLLSSIIFFVSVLSSFSIKKYTKGYYLLLLLLISSVYGCFLAHDFLLFFLFFEFMLLPMYFLIGIWGGERREYAAIKFFLYTLLGSVFILLVLIGTYSSTIDPINTSHLNNLKNSPSVIESIELLNPNNIVHSLDFDYIFNSDNHLKGSLLDPNNSASVFGWNMRSFLFFLILIGFVIKLPVVPVHTWLPDAHVEAPTAVSVILAGVLLKIGGYGILKIIMPLFPDLFLKNAFIIAAFGVLSMIYAGMAALAQKDLKKLIAYSSVSHMGYVMLGVATINREGTNGAIFQMVSHGFISSLLFILAGVIYERTHDREIGHYRGLTQKMPNYAVFSAIAFFASLGLPLFSGFIAEISVYIGAFTAVKNNILPIWLVLLSLISLMIGASYSLWVLQRIFFGEYWIKPSLSNIALPDLSVKEYLMVLPLVFFIILLGVFPSFLFDIINQF